MDFFIDAIKINAKELLLINAFVFLTAICTWILMLMFYFSFFLYDLLFYIGISFTSLIVIVGVIKIVMNTVDLYKSTSLSK